MQTYVHAYTCIMIPYFTQMHSRAQLCYKAIPAYCK